MITLFPEKKLERLHIIMLEAAEQSWNRDLPKIKIYNSINMLPDFSFYAHQSSNSVYDTICKTHKNHIKTIIIGPE
jgi:16S rRNA U1498 N3-methylase RsmE